MSAILSKTCAGPECGQPVTNPHWRAKYCSNTCRGRAERARNPEYYEAHREERKAYMREYYAQHAEKWAEADRQRRESDPAGRREYMRQYREANPEKWANLRRDPKRAVAAARRWKDRNPESVKLSAHHRRVAIRAARPVSISESMISARVAFLGRRCWICRATDVALTWDHVKPIAAGGVHALSNLRLACVGCNSRKGAKWYGIARLDELVAELQSAAYMGGGR